MTTSNWSRVKQIFHEALEVSGPERDQLIDGLCGDDEGLRSQVGALLAAHDEADELLDAPTVPGANAAASAASGLASSPAPEGPGTRVGAYKLLQQIGEGGFGVVYMAEQEEPIRRRVALKIIKPGMDTKQVIARFEAERQALAMMDHPNIAKVFDAGAAETGRPYFVMELVRGVPITEYCDENCLSTRERLELFNEVCGALHHAHQNGIIHRDIKPSNVMVTLHDGTPVPKVIDFGVAKATHQRLTEKTLFTEYNQFIGTPAYMSPEQAALGGLEIDNRSDVYSLGVLLYELLTGTPPFDLGMLRRAAYAEVLRILKEEEPPKPSTRVSTPGDWPQEAAGRRQIDPYGLARILRGDLDWIVMKALEKNRSRRYETAADMAADVRRYFDQEPIEARPPSFVYRTRKFVNKRIRPISTAAVLVLLLGLEGVRSAWFTSDAPAIPGTAALAGPRLLLTSEEDPCFFGPQPSPDGSKIAYTDFCGDMDVYVKDLATGQIEQVTTEGNHLGATWFPDGKRILTASLLGPSLRHPLVLDLESGATSTLTELAGTNFFPHQLSPNGERLAGSIHHRDGNVSTVVVSVATGEAVILAENVSEGQEVSGFSPDSRYVLYVQTLDGNEDLYVMDLETRERQRLTTAPGQEGGALWSPDGETVVYEDQAGVWALPWKGGQVTGSPRLLRAEPLNGNEWTENGFYYQVENKHTRLSGIPVDPSTGRMTGEPEPLSFRAEGLPSSLVRWAPDMEKVALAGFGDGMIRILDGDVVSEYPVGGGFVPSHLWWAPDGSELFFTVRARSQNDRTGKTVIGLDPEDGSVRELFPRTEGINHIHVSPDGSSMVFFRPMEYPGVGVYPAGELIISDLGDSRGRVLATTDPGPPEDRLATRFGQPAFSPDGTRILFLRRGGSLPEDPSPAELWVVNVDGSDMRKVATFGLIHGMDWDPSGRFVAFQVFDGPEETRLWVVSVDDGGIHEIEAFAGLDGPEFKGWSPDGRWLTVSQTVGRSEYWVVPDLLGGPAR